MLIVADREWVLRGTKGKPDLPMASAPGVDPYGPTPLGRMADLQRGREPRFTPYVDLLDGPPPATREDTDALRDRQRQIDVEFQAAYRGAVAVATFNLSLAIRRAFTSVIDIRKAKGGPLWPEGAV